MYIEAMFKNERLCILFDANEEGWSGKQKRWSLAGAGHMDWAIQWHFIGCQMEQKRCKKRSLSEALCGFLPGANMLRGGEAPVVADLSDKEQTGQLAKNLERRCKHF